MEPIRIGPKKKIGFVCSGGGIKAGAFHLGVALALQETGFRFVGGLTPPNGIAPERKPMDVTCYVGSSAGAFITSYLTAGYSLENIFNSFLSREPVDPIDRIPKVLPRLSYQTVFRLRGELAKEQFREFRLFRDIFSSLVEGNLESLLLFKLLKVTGIFSTSGIEQFLREDVLLSNRFGDYISDLFLISTSLNVGNKVVFGPKEFPSPPSDPSCRYLTDVPISEAVAASAALQFVYAPYLIKHQDGADVHYVDGETRDTMSTHVAVDTGCDLVIASYTHQPFHAGKEIKSLTELGLPAILIQSLYILIESKINQYLHNKKIQRNAIHAVSRFCKQEGLSDSVRERIVTILEQELHHRMEVDSIYIHPKPEDSRAFLREHFSLSPKKLSEVVKSGYRSAMEVLKHYEFDRS